MIIDKESKDVVKSEELSSIKYSIDSDNFGLLFKMLRDNLYQNKEYTIIREYVSNAIDAHTEAGVDKPVFIEWVDASEKFIKLLNNLEKRKIISMICIKQYNLQKTNQRYYSIY